MQQGNAQLPRGTGRRESKWAGEQEQRSTVQTHSPFVKMSTTAESERASESESVSERDSEREQGRECLKIRFRT